MFFLRLISRIPLSILYLFSDFLFVVSFYLVGYRRKIVWLNLRRSFPNKSEAELRQIEKQFYHNLCDYGVETIKLLTIPREDLAQRMKFNNLELLEKYKLQNQSILMLASHQFNWEWVVACGAFTLPVPVDFVYQPQSSKFFNRFSLLCRTRFGGHAISRYEVARDIVKRKNILRGISLVADQYPGLREDKKHEVTFLNQPTVFFMGGQQIAWVTQYPVVYASIRKIRRGFYEASFMPIAEPPYSKDDYRTVEVYAKAVEKTIEQDPAGWLWSHNRWKTRHLEQHATASKAKDPGEEAQ